MCNMFSPTEALFGNIILIINVGIIIDDDDDDDDDFENGKKNDQKK